MGSKRLQNIDHTITLVYGSLIAGLPQIMEAPFRKAKTGSGMIKWRLHTQIELLRGVSTRIDVTPDGGGSHDERAMLEADRQKPDGRAGGCHCLIFAYRWAIEIFLASIGLGMTRRNSLASQRASCLRLICYFNTKGMSVSIPNPSKSELG